MRARFMKMKYADPINVAGFELPEYHRFDDAVSQFESSASRWITVAEETESPQERQFTLPALLNIDAGDTQALIDQLLSDPGWDIQTDLGYPTFWSSLNDGIVEFDDGTVQEDEGLLFKPFVFWRTFGGTPKAYFELVQNFVLYHKAYWSSDDSAFKRRGSDETEITVVRIEKTDTAQRILIDRTHLCDYLSAHRSVLVRYHEFTRRSAVPITEQGLVRIHHGKTHAFVLTCGRYGFGRAKDLDNWSRLHGKDVISPATRPDERHLGFGGRRENKRFTSFIIGVRHDGHDLEISCDLDLLHASKSYPPEVCSMTKVYFREQVLNKYLNEPDRYTIEEWRLTCGYSWGLEFIRLKDGRIAVELEQLSRLDFEEQLYWRSFNHGSLYEDITDLRSEHDSVRLATHMGDPSERLVSALRNLDDMSRATLGQSLFLPLAHEDRHVLKQIALPVSEGWAEFEAVVQGLAKLTTDSLNLPLLKSLTSAPEHAPRLQWLENMLATCTDSQTVERVIATLRLVQNMRSAISAHRKGSKFTKLMKDLRLESRSKRDALAETEEQLAEAVEQLTDILKSTYVDELKEYEQAMEARLEEILGPTVTSARTIN